MIPLELAATLTTLTCVVLAVKRSLWQFPVGILGTALFFVVVLQGRLYANAALQVFFVLLQVYGWWYWLGGRGKERPPVRSAPPISVIGSVAIALAIAWAGSWASTGWTDYELTFPDAATLSFSIVAQYLLDRKFLETWPVWVIVNATSIHLYANAGLWLFTVLYVFFFFNAFWGWWEWREAMRRATPAEAQSA